MKIERLLAITILLLNRRYITAADLASKFEVSGRTIYRDIDTLNKSGIPIISYQGYGGGYCIPDNYKMSRQLLTYKDMVSILTSLQGINRTLKNRDLDLIMEKIESLIPSHKKDDFDQDTKSIFIDISPWGGNLSGDEIINTIHTAITNSQVLHFSYSGSFGKKSAREVEPHTLVYKNFNWYVLGFCKLRGDFRIFKLNRMHSITLKNKIFTKRNIEPKEYFSREKDSREPVVLMLKVDGKMRMQIQDTGHFTILETLDDGTFMAQITLPEDEWIGTFLLSFGSRIEVLKPKFWRDKIKKSVLEMKKIYGI